ncbi:hypothetical protein LAZ67_17002006 [Cordylochernes scorpioides]|uniref:SPIN-DOC-like zinc-finger domain-containing protein n=1 Tax=Cordylochernes scorpioides TaxID=51811 RepID=A0ABY6LDR4_9ARAC|nr:hypothetical protein LAZ67_17002006 [Cordylochernes scorpioides]
MYPNPVTSSTFDLTSSRQCSRQQAANQLHKIYKLYMERLQRQQEYKPRPSFLTELLSHNSITIFFQTFVFNMSSSKPSGSKTKRKIADEHRNFQEKWELEYFCSEVKDKIICLICNNAISVPKLYNIKRHYEQHKSKYYTYEGLMRQEKFKKFKLGMKKQQFMFTKVSQESEAAVHASYVLSEMIAKHSKPFTEGDFIKECLIKAAEIVCPGSVKTFQAISLSRNTVVERVTDMARNLNDQIKEKSSCFEAFSIACDEKLDVDWTLPEELDVDWTLPEELDVDWTLPEELDVDWTLPEELDIDWILPEELDTDWTQLKELDDDWTLPEELDVDWTLPEELDIDWILPEELDIDWILPEELDIDWTQLK